MGRTAASYSLISANPYLVYLYGSIKPEVGWVNIGVVYMHLRVIGLITSRRLTVYESVHGVSDSRRLPTKGLHNDCIYLSVVGPILLQLYVCKRKEYMEEEIDDVELWLLTEATFEDINRIANGQGDKE